MTLVPEALPVAGLSAASSCIRLSLTTTTTSSLSPSLLSSSFVCFRPVFTHQCFEGECIVGWRPLLEAEEQSRDIYRTWKDGDDGDGCDDTKEGGNNNIHKSYNQLELTDEKRMDVHITLAPSCDTCRIEIQTETHTNNSNAASSEPLPKKVKKTVSFQESESDKTQQLRMKLNIHDIVQKVSLALPPIISVTVNGTNRDELVPTTTDIVTTTNIDNNDNWKCLSKPPYGKVLKSYHRQKSSGEESKFILTMANGSDPDVVTYHNSIQPLARWFIETADNADLDDASRGQWKVMYLFIQSCTVDNKIDATKLTNKGDDGNRGNSRRQVLEERLQPRLDGEELAACNMAPVELVGYITLLHVPSPFRKPKPGIIVRICQVLILPPYHRAGHGAEMIKCIHEYAENTVIESTSLGGGMEIVEINVEDPAKAFVALRESVDYARFTASEKLWPYYFESSPYNTTGRLSNDVTKPEFFAPTPEDKLVIIAELLRITKRQALIMDEIWMLQHILKWKSFVTRERSACDELIDQVETQYRLMVKKSIRTLRLEELGACEGGKEGQKALLAKWFDETMCQYRRVLRI